MSANQNTVSLHILTNETVVAVWDLHAEAGPVDDDVDEVEGQPGEEGDQDDADEEEESLLAPSVTLRVRSPPQRELGQLQVDPGIGQ